VKYIDGTFEPLEYLHEEFTFANNSVVFGANCSIKSITSELSISSGGSDIETVDSIKFNAPKFYSTQNRAITSSDYEALIKSEYPFIESVIAWGSDEDGEDPGTVYVSGKPYSREYLDSWEKDYILTDIITPKKMIGLTVIMKDPEYVFVAPTINVKYDSNASLTSTSGTIKTAVQSSIKNICSVMLNKFKRRFYYTSFCAVIDNSNEFILGNETTIQLYRKFYPILNTQYTSNNSVSLNYSNKFKNYNVASLNNIYSSLFTCVSANTNFERCHLEINEVNVNYLNVANSSTTIVSNAGEIDYVNGIITLNKLKIFDTELKDSNGNSYINIYATPDSNDLVSGKNQILMLSDVIDITTEAISTKS
jgi:hypothetical protein